VLYQDCDELGDWIAEKMLAARDDTYRDAKNAHSKWMRHQVCILCTYHYTDFKCDLTGLSLLSIDYKLGTV